MRLTRVFKGPRTSSDVDGGYLRVPCLRAAQLSLNYVSESVTVVYGVSLLPSLHAELFSLNYVSGSVTVVYDISLFLTPFTV